MKIFEIAEVHGSNQQRDILWYHAWVISCIHYNQESFSAYFKNLFTQLLRVNYQAISINCWLNFEPFCSICFQIDQKLQKAIKIK